MPSISADEIGLKLPPFSPYVFIRTTSRMPSSIAMAAAAGGGMKYINLPPTTTAAQLPTVQKIVQENYRKNEGNCALFGCVTGYLFVFSPTEGILMDSTGNEVGRRSGKFYPKSVSIQDRL